MNVGDLSRSPGGVSTDKPKQQGGGDVWRGVRWFIVPMKRVTTVEGRDLGNNP